MIVEIIIDMVRVENVIRGIGYRGMRGDQHIPRAVFLRDRSQTQTGRIGIPGFAAENRIVVDLGGVGRRDLREQRAFPHQPASVQRRGSGVAAGLENLVKRRVFQSVAHQRFQITQRRIVIGIMQSGCIDKMRSRHS